MYIKLKDLPKGTVAIDVTDGEIIIYRKDAHSTSIACKETNCASGKAKYRTTAKLDNYTERDRLIEANKEKEKLQKQKEKEKAKIYKKKADLIAEIKKKHKWVHDPVEYKLWLEANGRPKPSWLKEL